MELVLVQPNLSFLPAYIAALREGSFSPMQLAFGLDTAADIESDPQKFINKLTEAKPFFMKHYGEHGGVYEHEILWMMNDGRFVGALSFRYRADADVIKSSGHLGFALRPSLVNHGYGAKAVYLLYRDIAKRFLDHKITQIVVACHESNNASRRLIENFGGKSLMCAPKANSKLIYQIDFHDFWRAAAKHQKDPADSNVPPAPS